MGFTEECLRFISTGTGLGLWSLVTCMILPSSVCKVIVAKGADIPNFDKNGWGLKSLAL